MDTKYTLNLGNIFYVYDEVTPAIFKYLSTILEVINIIKEYDSNIIINVNKIVENKFIIVNKYYYGNKVDSTVISFSDLQKFMETIPLPKDKDAIKYYYDLIVTGKDSSNNITSENNKEKNDKEKNDKEKSIRDKEKDEELKNIFMSDKKIYQTMRRKIDSGVMLRDNIPSLFTIKYNIFELLSDSGLSEIQEFEEYKEAMTQINDEKEFDRNKSLFYRLEEAIQDGSRTTDTIPEDFVEIYTVLKYMEDNNLFGECEYDKYLELMNA